MNQLAVTEAARQWIAADPCATDRAELAQVLAAAQHGSAADVAELGDRMRAPLTFGTAGIRGPLRAGRAGMNLAVVRKAAAGIGAYLWESLGPQKAARAIVIVGFDARHRSAEFAEDAAKVLASMGFEVLLAPSALPTPITAFAVRQLGAVAGLQITASHNPREDNGLKVYLAGGTQLVSPADTAIEAAIAASAAANSIDTSRQPLPWPDGLIQRYLAQAASVATPLSGRPTDLRIVATPLHGVGGETLVQALHLAGFTNVQLVASQARPDPDFPTVGFPNPEEPGATDELLQLAEQLDADLAIANDPDADRCSIGVKDEQGRWRMLSGDETGSLLGDFVLSRLDRAGVPNPLIATTIVSSQLLGAIASARGARYDETLTGFKWIVRAGDGQGTGLVFGYEEALGLAVDPEFVRDKDGISAAVLACALAAELKATGRTILSRLDDLSREFGLHSTGSLALRVQNLSVITRWMADLRADLPTTLLGQRVIESTDLLPLTDGIRLRTDRIRVVVRPSGTEPKLKCYLEIVTPISAADDDLARQRVLAEADLERLREQLRTLFTPSEDSPDLTP